MEFATRIFWGPGGEFLHALGIVRDITESVAADAALREREMRTWRIAELMSSSTRRPQTFS